MGNLQSAVDELLTDDVRQLPAPALADRLVELDREVTRLQSAYLTTLEAFDRSGAANADYGSTQAWVRATLRKSPSTAARDVHLARDLADRLPSCRVALAAGNITVEHAQLIASLKRSISEDALAAAEPHLVDAAQRMAPPELRGFVAHVRHAYAPDKAREQDQDDYAARELHASTTIHGLGIGNFTLHPAGMETFLTALHAASKPSVGDDRTPAQRRADALITMAEITLRSAELPITGGVKPHITIRADLSTLVGTAGAAAADTDFGATLSTDWVQRFAWTPRSPGSCSDPPANPSTSGAPLARSPRRSADSSPLATSTASGPAATARPAGAMPTTASTGPTADPPTVTTECSCAAATTTAFTNTATRSPVRRKAGSPSTFVPAATRIGTAAASEPLRAPALADSRRTPGNPLSVRFRECGFMSAFVLPMVSM